MPLIVRLGQYTLEGGLGGPMGPVGLIEAVESNEISTELYGRNIPIQLMPAILMRGPDCRIDAASSTESIPWRAGSILCIWDQVGGRFQWNSTELYGRIIPIQPVLRVLLVLSATAVIAAVAGDLHSQFGLICGPCRTIRILWEDRIPLVV